LWKKENPKLAEIADVRWKELYSSFISTLSDQLVNKKQEVRLTGFGTFAEIATKERAAMNLQTKQKMIVPASKRIRFSPSATLKKSAKTGKTVERKKKIVTPGEKKERKPRVTTKAAKSATA
jgi:nucleoid DNA-binding protein